MIAVQEAWSRDTSADPDGWSEDRPSHGQCAVTALVVQKLLGGELLRTLNGGVSHYWNRLPDDTEVDLTRDQFPEWSPGDVEVRDRGYVLSFPATSYRYALLTLRMGVER